jgi:hypothetical protein
MWFMGYKRLELKVSIRLRLLNPTVQANMLKSTQSVRFANLRLRLTGLALMQSSLRRLELLSLPVYAVNC